ncbi:MAG: hypothetical protein A3E05_04245 [Candidatus Jacksonbacteria bacterium RIFCSPHIGHO2_12_FULL_44_12]|nr:MAG: hypothetical protein A3E05_04245 [Candidatus Jacksonbacteria bacterium RIFCSPHIGHO2_12_FULL_44_12]
MIKIRTDKNTNCHLCDNQGIILYKDLTDSQGLIDGSWDMYQCKECSLLWLNPRTIPEDIPKLYPRTYYTHAKDHRSKLGLIYDALLSSVVKTHGGYGRDAAIRSRIGWFLGLIPIVKTAALRSTLFVTGPPRGTHLDVGCGSGLWLKKTKKLGWNTLGIDHDKEAIAIARKFGLHVLYGNMENSAIESNSIEIVTARHVLEHVLEPRTFLKECLRVLKPGGRAIIITPNIESYGAQTFSRHWRGFEPPRHLYLFSVKSLALCAKSAGFNIETCTTLTISAFRMAMRSYQIKNQKRNVSWSIKIRSLIFMMQEAILNAFEKRRWEEVLLIATKPDAQVNEVLTS